MVKEGKEIAIISLGHIGNEVTKAIDILEKENIFPAHYDARFLKPLDEEMLHAIFKKFNKIITVEDGAVTGGFGSAILEFMSENNYTAKFVRLGIPDKFIEHGTQHELWNDCGYDSVGVIKAVQKLSLK